MAKTATGLACCIALVACVPAEWDPWDVFRPHACYSLVVSPAPNVGPELRTATRKAIQFWNEYLGDTAFLYLGTGWEVAQIRIRHIELAVGTLAEWRMGAVSDDAQCIIGGEIWVDSDVIWHYDADERESIMRHELGHILGLPHNPDDGALMGAYVDTTADHPQTPDDTEGAILSRIRKPWRRHL